MLVDVCISAELGILYKLREPLSMSSIPFPTISWDSAAAMGLLCAVVGLMYIVLGGSGLVLYERKPGGSYGKLGGSWVKQGILG